MKVFSRQLLTRRASDLARKRIRGNCLVAPVISRAFIHYNSIIPQSFKPRSLVFPLCHLRPYFVEGRTFSTDIDDIEIIELGMPALSPTMEMGTIAMWHKKVGDHVNEGEVLADIETDKATVAFESTEEGYLAAIYVEAGVPDVPVNTIVGLMVEEEEELEIVQAQAKQGPSETSEPPAEEPVEEVAKTDKPLSLSPAVEFHIHTHHIDPASIVGTGPKGRILKGDVLKALANNTAKIIEPESPSVPVADEIPKVAPPKVVPAEVAPDVQFEQRSIGRGFRKFVDIPHTNMRKVVATQAIQSKSTVPHTHTSAKIGLESLLQLRKTLEIANREPPSIDDFIIKAAALACRAHPKVNSRDTVDIGVAVATDAGFITPVLEKADVLRLGQIGTKVQNLVDKVHDGKSQPEEFIGGQGSFTISNLGKFDVTNWTATINAPETCNLAVGKSQSRVIVGSDRRIQTSTIMEVTLACDERAVDNHTAAEWMSTFQGYMEDPSSMLST